MFSSGNSTVFDFVNEDQHVSDLPIYWTGFRKGCRIILPKKQFGVNVPYIRGKQAKLYLDEVLTDPSMIANLPVINIAMVKIIKGSGLIGDAVAVYTLKGDMKSKNREKPTQNTNNSSVIKGYDRPSEFIVEMIDDDSPAKIESDTRETLYWNPNLFDSDYVPPRIKFFNNDSAKQYKVKIISFDEDDHILYQNEIFK